MTNFELFKGQSINLDKLPIKEGQLIFTIDDGRIYLDISDDERKEMASLDSGEMVVFQGGNANSLT